MNAQEFLNLCIIACYVWAATITIVGFADIATREQRLNKILSPIEAHKGVCAETLAPIFNATDEMQYVNFDEPTDYYAIAEIPNETNEWDDLYIPIPQPEPITESASEALSFSLMPIRKLWAIARQQGIKNYKALPKAKLALALAGVEPVCNV